MLLLALLLGLAASQPIDTANTTCFGASFRTIASQFKYKAFLDGTNCSLANTRVTHLFILGACSKQHDNNFNGQPPPCPPGDWNVLDTSSDTCNAVFSHARPEDIRYPSSGQPFDAGHVCNDGYDGIIFVETDCQSLTANNVKLMQDMGGPDFCWDGHTFSHAAFAGVLAGGIIGVILLFSIPIVLYLWRRRRRRLQQAARVSPEEGVKGGKEGVEEVDGSFIVTSPVKSAATTAELEAIEEGDGYDVEYEDSEAGTTPHSGIPVSSFAGSNRA